MIDVISVTVVIDVIGLIPFCKGPPFHFFFEGKDNIHYFVIDVIDMIDVIGLIRFCKCPSFLLSFSFFSFLRKKITYIIL